MSNFILLNLRENVNYQREEINSLKSRVRLLETQEFPFINIAGPVSNAQLAQMPASSFKGNNLGVSAIPKDLTPAEAATMLMGVSTWSLTTINNSQINTGIVRRNGAADLRLQPFNNPSKGILIQDATGYVGLNETSPDGQLHVTTPASVPALTLDTEGSADDLIVDFQQAGTLRTRMGYLDTGDAFRITNNYGPIRLQPGSGGAPTTMLELTNTDAEISDTLTVDQDNTSRHGLRVEMPASTSGDALVAQYNGVDALLFRVQANRNQINFPARDMGNNEQGSGMVLGRNSNAGAAGPAPGFIYVMRANGGAGVVYADNANLLRIHNAVPTGSTGSPTVDISAGVVVGTQTSHHLEKRILGPAISPAEALSNMLAAASMVEEFEYLSGAFGGERFSGLVLRGSVLHRYGMDADEWHPAGRSLNTVNLHGDTVLAITELARRLALVEANLGLGLP